MSESQPSWIGRTIGNRYQIEALLGRGGMSSVYKATDPNLQRTVAVKIIHPHLSENPEFVKRFEQEAAAVAQLRHPNIIQVHDFDHHGDVYYMILEYVPGETLEAHLQTVKQHNQQIPLSETIHVMTNLCEAVTYAHERNMIHRDLKPSNVIITPKGEPILMDFGIAKIVGGDHVHTATGATIGTAAYMAPEQVKGEDVDPRADIYSLGVILFEMVSGRPPYEGKSAMTVMMKHLQDPVPDIRVLNTHVPDILVGILEKALAKDPADRFYTAQEIGDSLQMVGQHAIDATEPKVPIVPQTAVSTPPPPTAHPTPPPTVAQQPITQTVSEPPPAAEPPPAKKKPIGLIVTAVAILGLIIAGVLLWPRFFPSIPSSAGMVNIPAGTYTVGTNSGSNQTASTQEVALETYWIDQYEVTNGDYAAFLAAANGDLPSGWPNASGPTGREAYPVQGVSWEMAEAYCGWADKRLPTEAEWEVAARGPSGLLYPWGDERDLVTFPSNETYASGTIAVNRSGYNVYDLAGNVWEWVDMPYTAVPNNQQVLRGGSYDNPRDLTYRLIGDPNLANMQASAGFRCAATEVEIVPEEGILVEDDFIDPESGWETWDDGSVLYGYHPPDFYHVQAGQPDTLSTAFFDGNFDDVTMESLVFVDATNGNDGAFRYGLVLRRSGDSFYGFTIAPRSGDWAVLKNTEAGLTVLDEGTVDGLQGLNGKDNLRVDASGSDFAFSINGRLVSQLSDSTIPEGDIGFMVQTFDETRAHIHFDKLTVRDVAYQPSSTVLISDDFTDPESGWPSVSEGSVLSGYHPPDYYHVQSGEPNHRSLAVFNSVVADFTMETDVFVDSTDTPSGDFYYGLLARRVDDNYYAFMISPQTGAWRVIKNSADGEDVLAEGNEPLIQSLTAVNHLRVDAEGENMVFQVNNMPLVRVSDSSYAEGDIGFIVETLDQARAHIHYDTFTLREAEIDIDSAPVASAISTEPTPEPTTQPTIQPTTQPTIEPSNQPSNKNMVMVDGGTYELDENTAVALEPFWLDQYEVTNAQFSAYLEATGATSNASDSEDDHPVRGVTWDEADSYCGWANKRLPTEAEWVIAGRGPQGWLYPWGNEETAVSLPDSGTYAVGSVPENRSYFGAYDMAGNVWEWVGEPFLPVNDRQRVLRGGANGFQQDLSQRLPGDPTSSVMTTDAGFRCAASEVTPAEADSSLLLADDFTNVESGWWQAREPVDAYFYGYHPTDYYHMQISADNDCLSIDNDIVLDNFMAEVQIFTASTDTETGNYGYGLTVRQIDDGFYSLMVSPRTQTWRVLKSTPEGLAIMAEGESTTILGEAVETRDRLFVIANGPQMTFFVNGELVATVVDDAYENGRFGFIVNTLDETYAHVHFDSVMVWELPAGVAKVDGLENTAVAPVSEPVCRGSVVAGNTLVSFITHTVSANESVNSIAEQYNITPEALMGANGRSIIDPNLIRPGQELIIPQN